MSKKDKDELNEQEPWDQPIYEDQTNNETEDDNYSRADKRYKEEGKNWYVIILVILLFLIVLVPVLAILYFNMSTSMNEGTDGDKIVVQSSSSVVAKESSSTSEIKETESSTTESSSSSSSSSSSFEDVEVAPGEADANNEADADADADTNTAPAVADGSTVNYGEGDNISIWRIAQNNGMDLNQIYQLNPGLEAAVNSNLVENGQAIRVK